jgi:hypothetical protein
MSARPSFDCSAKRRRIYCGRAGRPCKSRYESIANTGAPLVFGQGAGVLSNTAFRELFSGIEKRTLTFTSYWKHRVHLTQKTAWDLARPRIAPEQPE